MLFYYRHQHIIQKIAPYTLDLFIQKIQLTHLPIHYQYSNAKNILQSIACIDLPALNCYIFYTQKASILQLPS